MGLQWENMQKFLSHWCEIYLCDGEAMLRFTSDNWPKNEELNIVDLTHKLATLLFLAFARRVLLLFLIYISLYDKRK